MDKFDSLRKSIRQILEQEDQLGRMSPEEFKRLRLALAAQPQIGQDDVEVTTSVVDNKVIDNILYRNKYQIGYVEYNGLMHLLCVLKVYGQKNPLSQDLKDFINRVINYAEVLSKNTLIQTPDSLNKSNSIEQSQEIEQELNVASHNIRNKNRLVEAEASTAAITNFAEDIRKILNFLNQSDASSQKRLRRPDISVKNIISNIKSANTQIGQGLGFFVEVMFYTYAASVDVSENEILDKRFIAIKEVFHLKLKDLKTKASSTYNATIDYAILYFKIYTLKGDTQSQILASAKYEALKEWEDRNRDTEYFAKLYSDLFKDSLYHAVKILHGILHKIDSNHIDSEWITGLSEKKKGGNPEYDLWLTNNVGQEEINDVYAKVDIKSYTPNQTIPVSKASHDSIGHKDTCEYFGFINLERSHEPFVNGKFSDLNFICKYFIIKSNEVNDFLSDSENPGVFALSHLSSYKQKAYSEDDFLSQENVDNIFSKNAYYQEQAPDSEQQSTDSEQKQIKSNTSLKKSKSSDKADLLEKIVNPDLARYFYMKQTYKYPSGLKSGKQVSLAKLKKSFKQNLIKNFSDKKQNFPIVIIDEEKGVNKDRLSDKNLKPCANYSGISYDATKEIVKRLHINHQEVNDILEISLKETLLNENFKIPFIKYNKSKVGADTKFTVFNNIIFNTLSLTLKNNFLNIIYQGLYPNNLRKHLAIVEVIRHIIQQEYSNNFLVKLNNEYNKIIEADIKGIINTQDATSQNELEVSNSGPGSKETGFPGSLEGDINPNQSKSKFDSKSNNLLNLNRYYKRRTKVDQKDNFTYFVFKPINSTNGGYKHIFDEFISQYESEISENIGNSKTDGKVEIEVFTNVSTPEKETLYLNVNNIANNLNEYFNNVIDYFGNDKIFVLRSKNQSRNKSYSFYNALNLYVSYYILQKASRYKKKITFQTYFSKKSANYITNAILKASGENSLLFKINKEYQDDVMPYQNKLYDSQNVKGDSHNIKGNIISENVLRSVIINILEEGDKKKSYRGSHPEESYGWSAKEEDFMFDLPGLTTWEEDRQWVKEYLKSMGMLKNKK